MKRVYTKPLISVEAMTLDQPIANVNCTASRDDMEILKGFGYFVVDSNCEMWIGTGETGEGGKIDWDKDGNWDDKHNRVCYHSNVTVAFYS